MSTSRLIAVSFADQASAQAAAKVINARFGPSGGIHVAPLGFATYPTPSGGVLSAWFRDDVVAAVRAAVDELGGTIEVDLDEEHGRRTR